ncbi:hypothetical protein GCM10009416_05060 [Craurococcus roseus]|uniref:Uncharacterized protein n=1 Tax=Craurococcus roseus TaxID=77585 RepID=A0ABN1EM96_9PROT
MSGSAYAPENPWPSYYGGAAQMDPQGIFGKVLGALAGPVGGMVAGPAGGVVGGMLGRQLGRVIPFGADPGQQFAPQGAIGDMIGAVGPAFGQHLGGMFGQPQLGQQLGNVLGTVGPMLPFGAAPQQPAAGQVSPELDPMGFNLGRLIRGAQQAVQTAQQAVNAVNTVRQFLPLAATPDAAGNGLDGGVAGQVSPELDPMGFNLGRLIRGAQQAVQTAQQAVNAVNTVRQFLPLAAGPEAAWAGQQQQQFAPQGAVGNLLGQVGPALGQHLGGMFGQPQLGQQLGNVLGAVGPMLPFGAAPQPMAMLPPELDPMGFSLGRLVRGAQQAVRTAQQAVNAVNTVRQFLPLAAGPEQQQFAPQGAVGNLLGQLGPSLGGTLGGWLGHQQLGQQFGNVLGTVGPMLPFAAGPQPMAMLPPELDPMGFSLGKLVRGAQQAVRTAQQAVNAVNTVRQFLPLAAQPQVAGQEAADLDPQGLGFLQNWLKQRPPILTTMPTHQHYGLPF